MSDYQYFLLYADLLRKGKKFEWKPEHTKAMKKLKKTLRRAETLKKLSYDRPIIVTVDTSPIGIGRVINQADLDGARYPIRFGAKVLNKRQREYAQVKRELWGVMSEIKADRDYLIGAAVVIETDCLPILVMMPC